MRWCRICQDLHHATEHYLGWAHEKVVWGFGVLAGDNITVTSQIPKLLEPDGHLKHFGNLGLDPRSPWDHLGYPDMLEVTAWPQAHRDIQYGLKGFGDLGLDSRSA